MKLLGEKVGLVSGCALLIDYILTITISMAIACYPANGLTRAAILRAADKAMYAAKEAGRDHIRSYDQIPISEEALDD